MSGSTIEVTHHSFVSAWYHVLSAYDLKGDVWNCFRPAYHERLNGMRPTGGQDLQHAYGEFHQQYRLLTDRRALQLLPLVATTETEFNELTRSIISGNAVPTFVGPLAKRDIGSLATPAGAALTQLILDLAASERDQYLEMYLQGQRTALDNSAVGLKSFLRQHLPPLLDVLYGELTQQIAVSLCEPLTGTIRSCQPARRLHHLAVMSKPSFSHAFFHILVQVTMRKTDRLIRHYFPPQVQAEPNGLIAKQMRFDAAVTTAYHVLLRHGQEHLEGFKEWALLQFTHSPRQAQAAVSALHEMHLLPAEAAPAFVALFSNEDDEDDE